MEEKIEVNTTEVSNDSNSKILSIILSALTLLLPLIFLSNLVVDFGSLKAYAFLLTVYILLFVWSVTRLKKDSFTVPFNLISLFAILVLLANLSSSLLSDNFAVSFWGRDFGFDSSFYLISLFLFFFLGSFVLKEVKAASYLYLSFIASAVLVILFHIILIFVPNLVPDFGYLFTNTTNTIGKWFDLGIFSGLVAIFSLLSIGLLKTTKRIRIALQVLLGASLLLMLFVGFNVLWIVLGLFSLIIFVYLLMADKISSEGKMSIPTSALVVMILSATIILSGLGPANPVSTKIQSLLGINFVDVRPSASATYGVIKDSVIESPIIGKNFTSFDKVWVKYKPSSINLTELWATDFRYGYGLIPSYFATTGSLGIISWLLFLGAFIYLGFISIFRPNNNLLSRYILASSFFSALYLWVMAFIYIPGHVTLFLTFLFSAVFVGSLYREEIIGTKTFSISKNPKYGFVYIFFVVILLVVSVTASYNLTEKFVAQIYARQSLVALQQGNLDLAQAKIVDAITFDKTDTFFKNLSNIEQLKALQIQNNTDLSEAERAAAFESLISSSIQSASAAVEYDPQNYSNFYYIGDLFTNLIPLNIEGISTRAIEFMNEASRLNPNNPEISLSLARIYLSQDNLEEAKNMVNKSLEIKSNYTNAVYLLSQVNVAEGEIDKAIENVKLTTLIRPNDPVTYFQLGLLQYQNEDFTDAITSFETALTKNMFYSNAKYFLGLSYYENSRRQDAINQFNELLELNPGNQEVTFILDNLKNGLAPFSGAQNVEPPIDDEPENRDEPPLDDDTTNTEADNTELDNTELDNTEL